MTPHQDATLQFPSQMPPGLAMDLGRCLTGHEKETALVRYLALAILYISWHFDEATRIDAYQLALHELPDDDSSTLLANLAHPPAYSRRGTEFGVALKQVKSAQKNANLWKGSLIKPGLNALRLHGRALELLDYVAAVDNAVTRTDEQTLLMQSLGQVLASHGATPWPQAKPPGDVDEFDSAVSALEYVLKKAQGTGTDLTTSDDARKAGVAQGIQIFNPLDARTVINRLPVSAPSEGNSQQRQLLENMAQSTGYRGVTQVPAGNPLAQMYERFPHFKGPLDFIARALALAACGDDGTPVKFSPLLVRGAPGTGKTYFAQELARVFGTHFVERDLSVTSEAFVITGMDAGFKNSKTGLVFNALVSGRTANPLICLNEVDKCKHEGSYNSPISSLYTLLEPASSRIFSDEYIPVSVDASHVLWVLTANDGPLPEPILSRLEVFNIQPPSKEQCRMIAKSVWAEVSARHMPRGHGFPEGLSEEILECLSSVSPRIMRKALMHTAGVAALNNKKDLTPVDLTESMASYGATSSNRSIGFNAAM